MLPMVLPVIPTIEIMRGIELSIEARPGEIVREGTDVELIVTSSNDNHYEFTWYQDEVLYETTSGTTLYLPDFYTSGEYYVTTTNDFCSAQSEPVYIKAEVFIPNIITPYNSNSLNDDFMVGSRSVVQVEIFNRYQQKIYEGTNGWDGSYRGRLAEPGTYYYRLLMKDGSVRKGTVEVAKF